ncbi:hypothetical protein ACIF6K_28390 [Streptomyces sp. NPDC085942]|uniref:hypothetical protein n=1 Tax=Streptomyces sp. NPDC085942 TaxID=3365743 RepID=UPI0037D507AE
MKAARTTATAVPGPQPAPPAASVQRPDPPEGYRETLAAHRAAWTTTRQHTRPEIQAAADRQLRDRLREPEEHFTGGRQALKALRAKAAAQQRARPSDVSRARTLQHLVTERASLATVTPAPAPAAPERLDRTA